MQAGAGDKSVAHLTKCLKLNLKINLTRLIKCVLYYYYNVFFFLIVFSLFLPILTNGKFQKGNLILVKLTNCMHCLFLVLFHSCPHFMGSLLFYDHHTNY